MTVRPLPGDLISEAEAAELLRVQVFTLRSWRGRRGLPRRYQGTPPPEAYRLPRGCHYSRADVLRFIEAQRVAWGRGPTTLTEAVQP